MTNSINGSAEELLISLSTVSDINPPYQYQPLLKAPISGVNQIIAVRYNPALGRID